MLHNYVTTALRNFARHKLYSFINVAGLAVGLTCAIFIILFVRDELSYDKWVPGTENLYRVETTWLVPGQQPLFWSATAFPVPEAMLSQLPEIRNAVHLQNPRMTVTTANRQFLDPVLVASPNFFDIIQLPLIEGNRATLLAEPESAVVTERAARKYFGAKPALGQMLKVGGVCEWGNQDSSGCIVHEATVKVTGVLRDLPHNTQLGGDVFIPNTSRANPMAQKARENWLASNGWGYVELRPGTDPDIVTAKLPALIDRNLDPRKRAGLALKGHEMMRLHLNPFRDDHLSEREGTMTPNGSWATVYGFIAVGLLILLIAGFNFTNLATARAMVRAREISLRKVVGARRGQLIAQFLGESVLTALVSLILALGLVEALLPLFSRMLDKEIHFGFQADWPLLLALTSAAILIGLLAGLYPALVLSRFRPALALRANAAGQSGSGLLRNALVVMQFAISIGLGIAALVVFAQISYARHIDLGLNKDGIVVVAAAGLSPATLQSLVHAFNADPALKGAAVSNDVPFSGGANVGIVSQPGKPGTSMIRFLDTGPGFFSLYDIRLLSGRALSESYARDKWPHDAKDVNILINRAAAENLGFSPQSAVGKILYADNPEGPVKRTVLTIVGVTSDFMFEGDRRAIVPTMYSYDARDAMISVRIPSGGVRPALAAIDRIWHAFAPSNAINRFFLSENFENQFRADEQQGHIFGLFVGIAIFIACLGLFGLAAFSTERRTKEMGIRKAHGARTKDIILLLLWQFSIPVLIANAIAWPVAYYYLHQWLEGYAYRISLNPLYFIAAGLIALAIAWATVIAHAAHVARASPIHALRYE
jgi:putative ABC transport system permease protein